MNKAISISKILVVVLSALFALPAKADDSTNALTACFADSTTGKERKELAKWIFIAIAAHPEMQGMSIVSDKTRDQINRATGGLVTRLLAVDCAAQVRAASANDGSQALRAAFGFLGQLAMQELMTNDSVKASLGGFEQYLDRSKIAPALSPK